MKKTLTLPADEREMIKKAAAGDEACFTALAEYYSKRIYNIGLKMLGNSEDAADMTQEALLKIYRYLGSFRGESAFSTWVYRVSVNCCRDMLREAARGREQLFLDFGEEGGEEEVLRVPDNAPSPEDVCLAADERGRILSLLDALDPRFRMVLVLREYSGLSYQEIGEAVGVSTGTVKSRISRARAALAREIFAHREQYADLTGLMECNEGPKEAVG